MNFRMVGYTVSLAFLLAFISLALAQSGGDYKLIWSTIDGGGGQTSGGPYILTGTIGQPDAGWMPYLYCLANPAIIKAA
jgi:hypothetical protein